MSDWTPSRPRPGLGARTLRGAKRGLPVAVWLACIALVAWLGTHLPPHTTFRGIVEATHGAVSAPVAGRIAAVLVSLHEEALQDQIVARLDDADVRLRLSQAHCELERLRADLELERADRARRGNLEESGRGLDSDAEQRRLVTGAESAQLEALGTRTRIEEVRVREQGAAIECDRLQELVRRGVGGEGDLVRARTEREALQKRIAELEALHAEQRTRIEATNRRLREFDAPGAAPIPTDVALAPMRWRLKMQEAVLERIVEDSKLLVLRAPIRGRIAQLAARPGEWIAAGQPVMTIVDATPRRILAYVPDALRTHLEGAVTVQVARVDRAGLGAATLQSISPSVVRVPERLWHDPRVEEWAFEAVIATTGKERPGEEVLLSLGR